jgi:hypothetical protein
MIGEGKTQYEGEKEKIAFGFGILSFGFWIYGFLPENQKEDDKNREKGIHSISL